MLGRVAAWPAKQEPAAQPEVQPTASTPPQLGGLVRAASSAKASSRLRSAIKLAYQADRERSGLTWSAIRCSGLYATCPRALWIGRDQNVQDAGTINSVDLQWLYDTGHVNHWMLQNRVLRRLGDVHQGWWRCQACGLLYRGDRMDMTWRWIPCPPTCECGAKDFWYVEVELDDGQGLTGHIDSVLVWPDRVVIVDFKSMDLRSKDAINPMLGGQCRVDHIFQAMTYVVLVGERYGCVLYFDRADRKIDDSMIEYEITLDDDLAGRIGERLRDCRSAMSGGPKPPRLPECPDRKTGPAKSCRVGTLCFSCD